MSTFDEKKIIERLETTSRFATSPEMVARDLERARQAVSEQASACRRKRLPSLRRLMKSRVMQVAAVLCGGIAILVVLLNGRMEIDGAQVAMARMVRAMDRMPVMHEVYRTSEGGPETHATETWYDFGSRTVLARFARDGQCFKIHSLNYDTMEEVVYEPPTPVVRIVYHCDYGPHGYPDSSTQVVQECLDLYGRRGAKITRERSQYEGADVDVYTFETEKNEHRLRERATLVVDRRTDLPLARTWKMWTPQGDVAFDQTGTFEFPAMGPKDIYEIGAPRSAEVVLDVASKERYETKLRLEQTIPQLEEEYQRVREQAYHPTPGQAVVWVPPSLARARLELDETNEEIRRLVDEQIAERTPGAREARGPARAEAGQHLPAYISFLYRETSDSAKRYQGRGLFLGGITLKQALACVIDLSVFDYHLPPEITDVNIPGDWVIRKDSSPEQRLAAFEKILREYTGRAITFQETWVEREVIVARGTFHFHPLTGTYNDTWIHVYADELDPDERSGGGSGSLAEFIRDLGEVNFNRQVLDETEGDRDVEVSYGWHRSSYIRLITDEEERKVKLPMVLDNVARQTGLTFNIERRAVRVWTVAENR
jgi:hypothetical protein